MQYSTLSQQTGAGEGNRTLVVSLEGFCSTIELHPRSFIGRPTNPQKMDSLYLKTCIFTKTLTLLFLVEGEGFEPSKAEPSDLQSDPFDRSGTPPNGTDYYEYIDTISQFTNCTLTDSLHVKAQ